MYEDGKIQKRVSKVTSAQLRKILFSYTDPAYASMIDHLRDELMKGLIANAQVKILAKLTTNKLGTKLMLKFLEFFYEEFYTALWVLRCERMILQERRHRITLQQKRGTSSHQRRASNSTAPRAISSTSTPRIRTSRDNDRLTQNQISQERNVEAYRRCESMIMQYITHRERVGWVGLL